MKRILSCLILSTFVVSACYIETKQPPKYVPLEKATKIEGGDEFKELAQKASQNFNKVYAEGNIQALFDLLDDKSQLKSDRVYWDLRFNKIKNELGKLERTELTRANAFQKSQTVEVRLEYKTKFEKDDGTKPRWVLFYWELYKNGDVKLLNYMNGIDNERSY